MVKQSIDWDTVTKEAVELLSKYIQIDTTNPPGNELAAAQFLQQVLEKESIACELYASQPNRANLLTSYRGAGTPALLLLHHMDVVPFEKDKWEQPPLSGKVLNGEVWGRGALDCKSLGIMQLMAFILLKRQGLAPEKHLLLVATADEEAGSNWGAGWLMQNFPEKLKARYVINEGGGLGLATRHSNLHFCQVAEKGVCWMRITFYGKPGHASLPHDSNCVVEMAKAIAAIAEYQSPLVITPPAERFICGIAGEQDFMPAAEFLSIMTEDSTAIEKIPEKILQQVLNAAVRNTFTPTVTKAGTKTNVIPAEGYCEMDCRMLPGKTPDDILATTQELLSKKGCKNFTLQVIDASTPTESPMDTPLYRIFENTLKHHDPRAKLVPYMSSGATDSRFFRNRGIPAYGMQMDSSLASMERMHGHNERITIDNLTQGIKVLYDVMKEFCI